MTIKERLLTLGIVEDNEYLDKYCKLIEANLSTKKEKFKTQSHHIVPRSYYTHHQMQVDNTKNNLVNVSHKDHVLAHYYLLNCSKTTWFRSSCLNALIKMFRDFKNINSTNYYKYSEDVLSPILDEYDSMVEESLKLRSALYTGRVFINDGVVTKTINPVYLDDYIKRGWQLGRLYQISEETKERIASKIRGTHHETSEETRRKIGEANRIALKGKKLSKERVDRIRERSRNRAWYNNGVKNIFIPKDTEPPEGFVRGMINTRISKEEWIAKVHAGRTSEDYNTTGGTIVVNNGVTNKHISPEELEYYLKEGWIRGKLPIGTLNWYNNGTRNTRASTCPDGFVPGRLLTKEVRHSLGNGNRGKRKSVDND